MDPAIVALAFPVAMMSVMGIAFTIAAMQGRGGLEKLNRHGSSLYLTILVAYAVLAASVTHLDLRVLGLVPDQDVGAWIMRTVAMSLVGGAAAWLLLFAELEVALRFGGRRARSSADGPERTPRRGPARADAATAGRLFALQAIAFAVLEEFLWRGIGVRSVQQQHAGGTEVLLLAAGVVLFGACHMYFGLRAVVSKTACGAVWCGLTVAATSIVPALVSHTMYQFLVARWNRRRATRSASTQPVAHPSIS